MKKVLIGGVAALALALFAGGGVVSMQPDTLRAEASILVGATAADLDPLVRDLRETYTWSPWKDVDPDVSQEWSKPTTGVGAWYTWQGNDEVGRGKQSVLEDGPSHVVHSIQFFEPMEGVARSTVRWVPEGAGLRVTWTFEQPADFATKMANLALDIESMLSDSYSKGMTQLKPLVEARAKSRVEQAAAAQAAIDEAKLLLPDPAE